jgi:hypothetical protein
MHSSRSLATANRVSIRHHGVDMIEEIGAQDLLQQGSFPGASSNDSVFTFLSELMSGALGVDLVPCLSVDLDRLYRAWCKRNQSRPSIMNRLINSARKEFNLPYMRKRYRDASGEIVGPHGMVFLGADVSPLGMDANEWQGVGVARFKAQVAQFEAESNARSAV